MTQQNIVCVFSVDNEAAVAAAAVKNSMRIGVSVGFIHACANGSRRFNQRNAHGRVRHRVLPPHYQMRNVECADDGGVAPFDIPS